MKMNKDIVGLDGVPYIGFDDVLPIEKFEALHLRICEGIARATRKRYTSSVLEHPSHGHNNWIEKSRSSSLEESLPFITENKIRAKPRLYEFGRSELPKWVIDEEIIRIYNSLVDPQEKRRFEQYAIGAFLNGEYVVLRTSTNATDPFAMFKQQECFDTVEYELFPELKALIDRLPFLEIGRVLIFLSHNHLPGELHSDRRMFEGKPQEWYTGEYHFIHFNLFLQKSFFICSDDGKKIIRTESKSIFFNTNDLHGTFPSPKNTYSIKVEGQFTKEFADLHGIRWKQRR